MKKILSAEQTRAADAFTIANEPITSVELMERAAHCFVEAFVQLYDNQASVCVVVGKGNNGGDGLAIARMLNEKGVTVSVKLKALDGLSADANVNLQRLYIEPQLLEKPYDFNNADVIIDALFDSGLNRPLSGEFAALVTAMNQSGKPIVSVDIPSGLMADNISLDSTIVEARQTLTFQRPKLTFLFPESGGYCGDLEVLDIGLDEDFIEAQETPYFMLDKSDISIPSRKKFDHKGKFGHAQFFVGSKGKMGAAVLSTTAALRVGAGLVTAHIPSRGEEILQTAVPEAMVTLDQDQDIVSSGELLPKTNAICIGPGIGTAEKTKVWLSRFLANIDMPVILDADAINIIAADQVLLNAIRGKAILTPHLGELERLIGPTKNGLDRLQKVVDLASAYNVVFIVKGAYTAVVAPSGQVFFNSTGNPGMATAGSGDVLAGVIVGLLAQGLSLVDSAKTSVYIHGSAGDKAKKALGEPSIVASDLLQYLPKTITNV